MPPRDGGNSERINVFFSPEVLKDLQEEAKKKGMTVSGLVRMVVLEYLENKK